MEEKPKSGLIKFKSEDRQRIYRESKVVRDLGTGCFQPGHKDSAISFVKLSFPGCQTTLSL